MTELAETPQSRMRLIAVTTSRQQGDWLIPKIPWFWFSSDETVPDLTHEDHFSLRSSAAKDPEAWRKYIAYLAGKRNRAIELALQKYPESTDVILCDTYYLHQVRPLKRLIEDYARASTSRPLILGGAIWGRIKQRIRVSHFFHGHKPEWYDKLSVPEMWFVPHGWTPTSQYGWSPESRFIAEAPAGPAFNPPLPNFFKVSSLGGISIWPRHIWEDGPRFGVFNDLPHGCELNYFFEKAPLPKYVDFNASFWRDNSYSFFKALRVSAHLGRFKFS